MPQIESVKLPTGVTLQYAEQGDSSGVPVLLLHGFSDSWYSFEPLMRHLPNSMRALALTQRGHGDSSRPDQDYSYTDFVADAAAFLDVLSVEAAVVVGHSMGGTIAQRFAIDHPGRTRALCLVASRHSLANSEVAKKLSEVVAQMEDPWKDVAACLMQDDFSSELRRIRAPTLLVWGDQDEMVPRSAQDALLATIAGSQLNVYEGTGHAVHWEEPERVGSDLTHFVEEKAK